jgi:hypothetical protein
MTHYHVQNNVIFNYFYMEKQWISTPFDKYFATTIEDMESLTEVVKCSTYK